MEKASIFDFSREELNDILVGAGFKSYKTKQIFSWLYRKQVFDVSEMSDLSKAFRQYLQEHFSFSLLTVARQQVSSDNTVKLLFSCQDGEYLETVVMRHNYGNSLCISTQIGCLMGCRFCASGLLKKVRDLSTGEMVLQVLQSQALINERIDNVVVMGSGEPFDNYPAVMKFLDIVNDDWGLGIGARHLTVSTCGLVEKMQSFSQEKPYNLALSLHAADDKLRDYLMPINKTNNLANLKKALLSYQTERNRRISIEYILLKGVNDRPEDVESLRKFTEGLSSAYINIIPYNSVEECEFKGVSDMEALKFYNLLKKAGMAVTMRNRHGDDIDAACGQLRNKTIKGENQ